MPMLKDLQMKDLFENTLTKKNKNIIHTESSPKSPSNAVLNAIFNYSKSIEIQKIAEEKIIFCLN